MFVSFLWRFSQMAKKESYEFVRLVGDERRVGPTLASVSRHWRKGRECFLFLSPHDDDVIIGGGLLIQELIREKVPVHLAVVTDGAMGYCSMKQKKTIAQIRAQETIDVCRILGIPQKNIHLLQFPDCQLANFMGRRPAVENDPAVIEGFTGLQNAFTALLRKVQPTQVFLPTNTDIHPDHRIVHSELLISAFHSSGDIWPELGETLKDTPYIHEMAIYCNFPTRPKLRLTAPLGVLENKLRAIAAFKSQKQIKSLVNIIRHGGPLEYFRPVEFQLYHPHIYRDQFEETPMANLF